MKFIIMFIMFCFVVCHYEGKAVCLSLDRLIIDQDAFRNVSEIIRNNGYPLEEHTVQTADGYLLSLLRISGGVNDSRSDGNKTGVVLLIHGELGDATSWVFNLPDKSLGFVLPDAGYDVWMINNRGCDYSKKHVKFQTNEYRFWNFSFDEIGRYDLPATIDYILDATGKEALYIIGYSRGNTATYIMLSEVPEYNKKVKLFINLGPVAFVGHFTSVVRYAIPFAKEIRFVNDLVTHGEFLPDNRVSKASRAEFCAVNLEFCEFIVFAVAGEDRAQLNETRLPVYAALYLSSTASKSLYHYGQLYESKKFRQFDYESKNMEHYGQVDPPDYDLSNITAPVALFWSTNDIIADSADVRILRSRLNSLVYNYRIPYPYEHFDFIWAKNAREFINKPLLNLLSQF